MTITYRPKKGVCSRLMRVEVENGIIRKVEVQGGVQRQPAGRFAAPGGDAGAAGHRAHGGRAPASSKLTSCPDELAKALRQAL